MRILFPIGSFYPSQQGGPCNSVYALAKGLVQSGHEVSVVTTDLDIPPDAGVPFDQWTEIDGVRTYYKRIPKATSGSLVYLYFQARRPLFLRIMGESRPDLVHASMLFYPLPHIAAKYARDNRIPLIWSPRGSMLPYTFTQGKLKKKLFLSMPWVKDSLSGCRFHATSEEEKHAINDFVEGYTGTSVRGLVYHIPNLVGEEVFVPGDDEAPYPFKYLLHLGRVHPKKKIENLIDAFALANLGPDIRLVIAGWTGEHVSYTQRLKERTDFHRLGQRVVFTEKRVESREKATLYRHARVFVLSSESENFGMVVLESLAQGTPVIASTKTPWDILKNQGAGYWVSNDPVSLASAIEKHWGQGAEERRQMSLKARALADEYRTAKLIDKYVQMYMRVAAT